MKNSTNGRDIAQRFAAALDRDDIESAASMLAPDCHYDNGATILKGPDAIINSYRESSERARRLLDEVRYESTIQQGAGNQAAITFIDHLRKDTLTYVYRCRQMVEINEAGRIASIRHEELDGEREALHRFFKSCGIEAS